MAATRLTVVSTALAFVFAVVGFSDLRAADFSNEATALPFPADAQELEFVAWSGDITYTSQSPLRSLAAFYFKEMTSRGWELDESAVKVEDDRIGLTFRYGKVEVEVKLRQSSKQVDVDLDCEKMSFTGTDDPAKLAAAGIPVPKAALLLQKDYPLPEGVVDLRFTGEGCTFKSSLSLQDAFAYYMKLVPSKGFRESRKPILSDSRKYTEFKKGTVELSVNIFTDAVGSRIVLEYKDDGKKPVVRPLAAVASLPFKAGGAETAPTGGAAMTPSSATPIEVTSNKGSATVNYNGKQYVFKNIASFRTKSRGEKTTMVVFSAKPIAYNKMQTLIATKDDFSFGDLYEGSMPDNLVVQLGDYPSFTFASPGLGIGHSIDDPVTEMKAEAGRVQGTVKMAPKEIFKGEPFSFTATVNASIITPTTRIGGPADPVLKSDSPILADSPVPFPEAVGNLSSEGSKFRKTYRAEVSMPLAEVTEFYRKELAAAGWKPEGAKASGQPTRFKNDTMDLALSLKAQGGKTAVEIVTRDFVLAKKEGMLPEPGKGRLILGNASSVAVVFSVGKTNHSLKAGQGAEDLKQAVHSSLAPGAYTVIIKPAGQPQQTEKIDLAEGTTWGVIALPTGGCLPLQLY
jgi:hypothetical protein